MPYSDMTKKQLLAELESQRLRLHEAEDALRAIRCGEVDALVITGMAGDQVYTLKGADHSYRLLVEGMDEGAVVLTTGGAIMYANRRFAEMVQTPLEGVIGSEIETWIAAGSQNRLRMLLWKNALNGRRKEMVLIGSQGAKVPVLISASRQNTPDIPEYICLVATDLSEINKRKRMEAAAISLSEYTRSLIEASLDPLMAIDNKHRITDVNIAAEHVTGINRDRLIDSDFIHYFTEPEEARAVLRKIFSEGYVIDYPLSICHVSGKITNVLYNAQLYHDNHGKVIGALTTARDITKRKQVEAQEVMERLNHDKDLFLANMSHELRTPLTAILQFATLAKRRSMEGRQEEAMNMLDGLLAGKERLLRFVTNIERLARIHVGLWIIHRTTSNLMNLIQGVIHTRQQRFAEKNLQWRVQGDQTISAYFDAACVSIILTELIDNAGQFSPKNSVIDLRVTQSAGQVKISILDSGPGIPAGEEEVIFSPFVQSSLTRSNAGGTGLGLSIARGLAQQHKAEILIANRQDGQGAEVTLVLPCHFS